MVELAIIPVLLAGAGAVMAAVKTLIKARTRHELAASVQRNAADRDILANQLEAGDLTAAEAVVRKHIGQLSPAEQREAEEALAQSTSAGRARYMRDLAARPNKPARIA